MEGRYEGARVSNAMSLFEGLHRLLHTSKQLTLYCFTSNNQSYLYMLMIVDGIAFDIKDGVKVPSSLKMHPG